MDKTCCPFWNNYIDTVLYYLHEYSYPESTSDYPYYQIFECNHV